MAKKSTGTLRDTTNCTNSPRNLATNTRGKNFGSKKPRNKVSCSMVRYRTELPTNIRVADKSKTPARFLKRVKMPSILTVSSAEILSSERRCSACQRVETCVSPDDVCRKSITFNFVEYSQSVSTRVWFEV